MSNTVNHPDHYKGKKFEAIDIIEDYELDFSLGNAVKYILRCGKKGDAVEDLKKAKWYIDHEICNRLNEREREKEKKQVDEADVLFAEMYVASKEQKNGKVISCYNCSYWTKNNVCAYYTINKHPNPCRNWREKK